MGRATYHEPPFANKEIISIHALRGEGDEAQEQLTLITAEFQSTPSVGRATRMSRIENPAKKFQSTPSVGRATEIDRDYEAFSGISIHALRGEGDYWRQYDIIKTMKISIHALRGEGDCKNIQICNAMLVHSAYKTIYFCDSCAFYLA